MSRNAKTTVVYQYWAPLGLQNLVDFSNAVSSNPPGIGCDWIFVVSGKIQKVQEAVVNRFILDNFNDPLILRGKEKTFDIFDYFFACEKSKTELIIFLNTHSRPDSEGWAKKLTNPFHLHPDIGLVGASGLFLSAYWHFPMIETQGFSRLPIKRQWEIWKFQRRAKRTAREFPRTPGPIIRTNGFCIEKERFLKLELMSEVSKFSTYVFESGWKSMTRQILGQGKSVGIVGKDGIFYLPEEWRKSKSYCSGEQDNLLIKDNQTERYCKISKEDRDWFVSYIFGNPLPPENPILKR